MNSFLKIVGRSLVTDTEKALESLVGELGRYAESSGGTKDAIENQVQGSKHLPLTEIVPQMTDSYLDGASPWLQQLLM